jgi:hypothetical protein
VAVYAYSDLNRITTYLADNELIWRGTWSAGTTYNPPDAVYHTDGNMWISLVTSTNVSPTAIMRQRMWSQLVYWKEGPPASTSTADAAYQIAVAGTNAAAVALSVAQSGTAGVEQVLQIAVAGTNLAQAAYEIAVAGTNLAIAAGSLAQDAYNLAVAGTSAAAAAQATADDAMSRLSVGLSGTYAVWVAPSSGSPATLQMFVVNGIVTAIV